MSFSYTRGSQIIECGSIISNSSITTSSIDMNGGVITSGGTPINPGDLVTKQYADSLTSTGSGIPTSVITLTDTNYTNILPTVLNGTIQLFIKNIISGGPSGSFNLSKSEAIRDTSYTRNSSSAGITTSERLEIRWLPNTCIELRKTGDNYNGTYSIKYILI